MQLLLFCLFDRTSTKPLFYFTWAKSFCMEKFLSQRIKNLAAFIFHILGYYMTKEKQVKYKLFGIKRAYR